MDLSGQERLPLFCTLSNAGRYRPRSPLGLGRSKRRDSRLLKGLPPGAEDGARRGDQNRVATAEARSVVEFPSEVPSPDLFQDLLTRPVPATPDPPGVDPRLPKHVIPGPEQAVGRFVESLVCLEYGAGMEGCSL